MSRELVSQSADTVDEDLGYQLIDINDETMATILAFQKNEFKDTFGDQIFRPTSRIGVGDVVSVVVWEPGAQGLFANSETGSRAELGPFQIEQNGKIPVPFVGQVTAKGRTIAELRWAIQSGLQQKAVDPQVVVSIQENASSRVTVNGAVGSPGQHPIALQGSRILDVLALAGSSSSPAGETLITLRRDNRQGTQLLRNLFQNPNENVYVRPGDQIFLTHDPQTFTAFGAVGAVGEYPISAGDVSLVEALGRVGGLSDNRANARGLFVFRYEKPQLLQSLGIVTDGSNQEVPVIYRLNMRDGQSYFFGQSFYVRDKDVLYVANSLTTELRKFIDLITSVTGPTIGTAATVSNLND